MNETLTPAKPVDCKWPDCNPADQIEGRCCGWIEGCELVEVHGYTGNLLGWSEGETGRFWPTSNTAALLDAKGIKLNGEPGK